MSFIVIVAYPRPNMEANFDMKYYTNNHMASVIETWKSQGLKSMTVTQHADGPYIVEAILLWESSTAFESASSTQSGRALFDDVPNFTNIEPILLQGDVMGSWKA